MYIVYPLHVYHMFINDFNYSKESAMTANLPAQDVPESNHTSIVSVPFV